MTYWVFSNAADAEVAEEQCFDRLPNDTLADGVTAPVQITDRWADVIASTDGRFGFIAYPKLPMPDSAVAMSDDDFAAIKPQPADAIL